MLETEPTYIKNEKDGTMKTIDPNPYMWLSEEKQDIFYQDGEFYTGKGEPPIEYKDVPDWFWNMLKKSYSREVIDKWGIVLPENRVKSKEEKEADIIAEEAMPWECDEPGCGKSVPMRNKGAHIMGHANQKKVKARREAKKKEVLVQT